MLKKRNTKRSKSPSGASFLIVIERDNVTGVACYRALDEIRKIINASTPGTDEIFDRIEVNTTFLRCFKNYVLSIHN